MHFQQRQARDLLTVKPRENVSDVVREILFIYDACNADADLTVAAYGLAVSGLSMSLNVSLRTAALLLEHALVLRKEKTCQVTRQPASLLSKRMTSR